MPSIAGRNCSPRKEIVAAIRQEKKAVRSNGNVKRRLRSDGADVEDAVVVSMDISPIKWKSPRRCLNSSPNDSLNNNDNRIDEDSDGANTKLKSTLKSTPEELKLNWNSKDPEHVSAIKEALHVSTAPHTVVCREDEQRKVFEFCKGCVEQDKGGSLYVCGCPGTGKSLSVEKVKKQLVDWANEAGFQAPDVLSLNCTSLTKTSEIFSKILSKDQSRKKFNGSPSPLKHLQNLYSREQSFGSKMMLIVADELDYLITRDRAVLHDLFMLTTLPFSRCILIGVANAIDLADRFLPKLQSLNCKPAVVTFRAYSKDQILRILQQRLTALPFVVFQPLALELCARKVAAASGDMRKALCVCRNALEILETELRESTANASSTSPEEEFLNQESGPAPEVLKTEKVNTTEVKVDHMAAALSQTFKSPVVDTIQSLPQHQQIILCSAVKFFRGGKKDTTVGELYKSYTEVSKSVQIPPVGILEFSSMCRVLNDQGLLKLGQSREERLKRVTLKIDGSDITFALQGVRFFRNCLQ